MYTKTHILFQIFMSESLQKKKNCRNPDKLDFVKLTINLNLIYIFGVSLLYIYSTISKALAHNGALEKHMYDELV